MKSKWRILQQSSDFPPIVSQPTKDIACIANQDINPTQHEGTTEDGRNSQLANDITQDDGVVTIFVVPML